ncbi:MAG: phosphatidylglycerol lysyltransferase domain-containing protein [Prevotella sp.]|jgi:hypothetical protein|nr:phosphatidylglycerol lysyltransferase domain-containing protein [Prevotella sp.]
MLNFRQIELSDKNEIEDCLASNTYRACDFSFTNMWAWAVKFKTVFAIKQRTLFLRFSETDGRIYYMLPLGKMPLPTSISEIMEDAGRQNKPFLMKGVTPRMKDAIEEAMPGLFDFAPDRNNDEYLYLSEKLIRLTGKKLQSKRNHINRFKKEHPDWQYEPVATHEEAMACLRMLKEWETLKSSPDGDRSLEYDYIATKLMLQNLEYLNLKAGAIRVNGKLVAFSVGERLTDDTFVVHVEKAFGEINGAYTIINQQFIEHEAAAFTYINREEDMGLEALRKAKLSYCPDILLQEYIAKPKKQAEDKP